MRARSAALVLALLVVLASGARVWAHASLMKAEPADGAVVKEAPATLQLTFNEPVSPLVMRLIGPAGELIALGDVAVENATVTIAAPRDLRRGTHALSWRVISADGHPVAGALMFSIGAPSAPPSADGLGDRSVRAALWAAKLVIYVGLFIGIGGAFFRAWIGCDSRAAVPWLVAALAAGLLATPISVGLQGLDALGLPLAGLQQKIAWQAGLETAYGFTAIAAAFALFAGLFGLVATSPGPARVLSLSALLGAGGALALSGHAATAAPRLLTALSVLLHGVGVAVWVGALLPLIVAVRHPHAGGGALARFSRVIPYPLGLLVVTGVVLAVVQLGRLEALWTTSYGAVLACKLAAVAALFALASANRYRLVPRFEAAGGGAARPLAISIALELTLVLVILALVALWRFTPPPRALATNAPVSIHLHSEKAMAQIELAPEQAGGARVSVLVLDGEFRPLAAKEVSFALSNVSAGIEPLRRAAVGGTDATWLVEDVRIPVAGRWLVRVEILISDFEKVTLEEQATLPRMP